jgi:hypothetical protein
VRLLGLVPLLPIDTVMVQTGHGDGVSHVHLAGVQPLPSECHSLGPVGLVHKMNYVASVLTRMTRRLNLL